MFPYALLSVVTLCAVLPEPAVCRETADETASIALQRVDGRDSIVVIGLPQDYLSRLETRTPAELSNLVAVHAGEEITVDQPAVLGTVRLKADGLIFRPRFPLKPGMAYRVVFRPGSLTAQADADTRDSDTHDSDTRDSDTHELEQTVRVDDEADRDPTVVQAVYPSAEVLPENLLKFYVHFSAPMAQGDAYRHVRILTEDGEEVDYPFVQLGQELWDRSGTRITLLLDPGRIKRGLRPREEQGPILQEGHAYELVIDSGWRDADGRPLAESFRKRFRAAPPDDVQPAPSKWRISPPEAGGSSPLEIEFEEPLDHAMLLSAFAVLNADGQPVAGSMQTADEEQVWRFVPENTWAAGDYALAVDASLEDRAGNSIERPFEVDLFERVQATVTTQRVTIPFRVR